MPAGRGRCQREAVLRMTSGPVAAGREPRPRAFANALLAGAEPAWLLAPDGSPRAAVDTPLADTLLRLGAANITSFHALPLSRSRSIEGSSLRDTYMALLGASYL